MGRDHAKVIVVAAVVATLVLARQPHAIIRPQFVWEEAAVFWATTYSMAPLDYLIEPWAGYLHVLPRAAFLVARLGAPEIAPAVALGMHSLLIGAVAGLIASGRFELAIPNPRVRTTFAISLAVLPAAEPYVSVLSAQWFLAIPIALLPLVAERRSDYPLLAIAGVSGVAALLALPLYWRDRRGLVLGACAVVQASLVFASGRSADLSIDWIAIPIGILIALALLSARGRMRRPIVSMAIVGAATMAVGSVAYTLGGRYLLAAAATVALAGFAGVPERRPLSIGLAIVVVTLALAAFSIPPTPDTSWNEHASCIGGERPCVVPVLPEPWSVAWPGDPTGYVAPRGFDASGMPVYP